MNIFNNRKRDRDEPIIPEPPKSEQPAPPPPLSTPAPNAAGFETVLGSSCVVDGSLECNGNIRLDGQFTGTLHITGNVLVGEKAIINADIFADNIAIAGTVRGNVGGSRVQLLRTSKVFGDISAKRLTTEEGAVIDGKVSMSSVVQGDNQPTEKSGSRQDETIIDGEIEEIEETEEKTP